MVDTRENHQASFLARIAELEAEKESWQKTLKWWVDEHDERKAQRDTLRAQLGEAEGRMARMEARLAVAARHCCPSCGPHVLVDEDLCCAYCGADTEVPPLEPAAGEETNDGEV